MPSPYNWTEESIALLGTMPDARLANKLGITTAMVFNQRSIKGIAPSRKSTRFKTGRPAYQWKEEDVALLGSMPDREVAEYLQLSHSTVFNKRRELGIKSCHDKSKKVINWTEDMISQLGTVPDRVLATKWGIHKLTILNKRHELGIPAYQKHYSKRSSNPTEIANIERPKWTLNELEAGHLLGWLTGLKNLGILDKAPGLATLLYDLTEQL